MPSNLTHLSSYHFSFSLQHRSMITVPAVAHQTTDTVPEYPGMPLLLAGNLESSIQICNQL